MSASHDFWAVIEHPAEPDPKAGISEHRTTVQRSPVCATQPELFDWIKSNTRAGDIVQAWRREFHGDGFRDVSLIDNEDIPPDPRRLAELIGGMRLRIELERSIQREHTRNPVKTAAQRGEEARERLRAAGEALKSNEPPK
jgi:hypothetical protein